MRPEREPWLRLLPLLPLTTAADHSGQQVVANLAENIRQAVITPLETVIQVLMIEAKQVEDRGLEIVHMDGVLRDTEAKIVTFSVGDTPLEPTACHEHRLSLIHI